MDEKEQAMRNRFSELAPWHVNGTLSESDREWVDTYVREHPDAAAELAWYTSLQQSIKADVPQVSPDVGLDRLLHRIRGEPRRASAREPKSALDKLLAPVQSFLASPFLRPTFAYAAVALVVVQAGLIGGLVLEQWSTEQEYAEYRSIATVPATGPLLRVSFRPDAREIDIRSALMDVGGTLVGGPGQLGEYLVRVPANRIEFAERTLRDNPVVEAVEVSAPAPK